MRLWYDDVDHDDDKMFSRSCSPNKHVRPFF